MSELDCYPVHRVAHRVSLFLEGDRTLMISLAGLCGIVAFYSGSLAISAFAVGVWVVCAPIIRHITKSDPLIRHVYQRYYQLKACYPARSTPFCQTNGLKY